MNSHTPGIHTPLRRCLTLLLLAALLTFAGTLHAEDKDKEKDDDDAPKPTTGPVAPALRFKLKNLDGTDADLMDYHGRVLIVMPIAWDSNRKLLDDLQEISVRIKDLGIVIVGVLTDSFGEEKRTDADVVQAIKDRYDVTFPIYARVAVKGEKIHPFFKYLSSKDAGHKFGGEIQGTYTRFLINRDGELVGRWEPKTPLRNAKFIRMIEELATSGMKN